MIGTTLGHYRILDKLGHGGMGEVYLAEDTRLKRRLALKVLSADLAEDPELLERFQREAESVAALNHPNIVTLYSVEEQDGLRFLTMELVEGRNLGELIPKKGLPLAKVFEMAIPFADALHAAHEKGIIHRDLKPANVMVTTEGRLKILDFGLAKLLDEAAAEGKPEDEATQALTRDGRILGTIPYMAPEQVQGKPLDRRSDIFSMGVILFEMATGQRPFSGETSADLISSILRDNPQPVTELKVDLPHHLGRIIRHCLEKNPERRYQSALDIRNELEDLKREVDSGIVHSETVALPAGAVATSRRRTRGLVAGAVVVLAVALSFAAWKLLDRPGTDAGPPAVASRAGDAIQRPSVAVLYFDNLSGDPELDWLRKGLTDMLVTDLSQSPDLRVLSTDRLYQILADMKKLDERIASFEVVREVAEEAQADTVILGSFAKVGDTIRISFKIQEAATGEILKADRIDANVREELFARVDDLSRSIRQSIELPKGPAAAADRDLAEVSTDSVEAYRFYVEAEALHYQAKEPEAIELYRKAVELDPQFAMAWAKLGTSHANLGLTEQSIEYSRKAIEHIDRLTEPERAYVEGRYYGRSIETYGRAIEIYTSTLDKYPHLTALWNNVAVLYTNLWMFDEGIAAYEQGIEQGDVFPGTYQGLAGAYAASGQPERAFDLLEGFLAKHPQSFSTYASYAGLLASEGRLEAAEEALARAEELRPGYFQLHFIRYAIAILREDWAEAEKHATSVAELPFPFARAAVLGLRVNLLFYQGRFEEAIALIQPSIDAWPGPSLSRANSLVGAAMGYYLFGQPEQALVYVETARQDAKGQNPDYVAHGIQVLAHQELGHDEEADRLFEELTARIEEIPGRVFRFWLHEVRGRRAILRGETAAGIAELELAAALLPPTDNNNPRVLYALANAYLATSQPGKAEATFRRLLDLKGARTFSGVDYVRSHFQLARILEAKGDAAGAREHYRTFVDYWGDGDMEGSWVEQAKAFLGQTS